jgi:hypothetical protein
LGLPGLPPAFRAALAALEPLSIDDLYRFGAGAGCVEGRFGELSLTIPPSTQLPLMLERAVAACEKRIAAS